MADADVTRYRDWLAQLLPWWLSDRRLSSGKNVGYRFLWAIVAYVDAMVESGLQALKAPWPGIGTSTALPLAGRSRGILRGQADTDDQFAVKLNKWLDKWRRAGASVQLATEIREYLGNGPRVRVITRGGYWVTVDQAGVVTTASATWNWDGTSHPERAGFWSEIFIVVYPTQWALGTWGAAPNWGAATQYGLGHLVTRQEVDAIRAIVDQWKSAHTKVRAIIWTSDATLFDPTAPATCPNGNWGEYGGTGGGSRTASSRNTTTCRYWEL